MSCSNKKSLILSVFAVLILMQFASVAGATVFSDISYKKVALVTDLNVTAADILMPDNCSKVFEKFSQIQLGQIPEPLGELVLTKPTLINKLGKYVADFEFPETINIRRQGAILRGTDIRRRIEEICAHGADDLRVDLSRVPARIVLPGNLISWELIPNSDNQLGMRLITLVANTEGGVFRTILQVNVSRVIKAAKLIRLASPGEQITSSMIVPEKVEVRSERAHSPVPYKKVVGKSLTRYKSAGTFLRSSDLTGTSEDSVQIVCEKPEQQTVSNRTSTVAARNNDRSNWIIHPGEHVDFHFSSGNLNLQVPARAIQGGVQGDVINLINLNNQRRIRGIITESGRVEHAQN